MSAAITPGEFSRLLVQSLAASDGRRERRKRNTTPSGIGLELKRALLERPAAADHALAAFEAWLLEQALAVNAGSPVRAMGAEIWDEYAVARLDPDFSRWLAQGAPGEDTEPD